MKIRPKRYDSNLSLITSRTIQDHLKNKEMCERAVLENLYVLTHVLDQYKTSEIRESAVDRALFILKVNPDWFVKQELVEMWQVMTAELGSMISLLNSIMDINSTMHGRNRSLKSRYL